MSTVADGGVTPAGLQSLHQLKSTEPPLYLTPSSELSKAARLASGYLFSSLGPHVPKSPFTHLLTEGFDAEQIWQQIDLQAQPLLSSLRRHVRNFEKNPEVIEKQFDFNRAGKEEKKLHEDRGRGNEGNDGIVESESEDLDDEEDEDEDEDEDADEDGEMENEDGEQMNGLDDKFFKVNELEELIADAEAKEYGEEDNEEKEDDDDDDEEDDDELLEDDGDDEDGWESSRYEDFFVKKKTVTTRKPKHLDGSDDEMDNDDDDDDDEEDDDDDDSKNKQSLSSHEKELANLRSQVEEIEKANVEPNTQKESLSTHEKELVRLRSEMDEMEKVNMEPKIWTMQGEVTAAKRAKNSALEVDLDFEHNVRPAPVITEEVTASLEEIIQKRILEGRFDDIRKPPVLMDKAPRERKELDENKSKKSLAQIYEDEYVQKTGLVSAALTFSDEQKKEASTLFKTLCLKLDALSHFHFTPKPVIEDMSIQANVPALAMEEIAPLAVSDAAMLAPEEVFSGKGDMKEETELTQAERKRRRANKKRKFKAASAKKMAMKAPQQPMLTNHGDGNEDKVA